MEAGIRSRCFIGACLAGICAGVLSVFYGHGSGYLLAAIQGAFVVIVAGHLGGFVGMLGVGAWLWIRYHEIPEYGADGVTLLSAFGAFLGLVAGLIGSAWQDLELWAAAGALIGGLLGGASVSGAEMLFGVLVLESLPARERVRYMMRSMPSQRFDTAPPPKPKHDGHSKDD